jgi:hypothetical protein
MPHISRYAFCGTIEQYRFLPGSSYTKGSIIDVCSFSGANNRSGLYVRRGIRNFPFRIVFVYGYMVPNFGLINFGECGDKADLNLLSHSTKGSSFRFFFTRKASQLLSRLKLISVSHGQRMSWNSIYLLSTSCKICDYLSHSTQSSVSI